jgi:hypothetical protein
MSAMPIERLRYFWDSSESEGSAVSAIAAMLVAHPLQDECQCRTALLR